MMGKSLSVDLRERVVAAVDDGLSRRKAAARFEVSISRGLSGISCVGRVG
jgi:transposase